MVINVQVYNPDPDDYTPVPFNEASGKHVLMTEPGVGAAQGIATAILAFRPAFSLKTLVTGYKIALCTAGWGLGAACARVKSCLKKPTETAESAIPDPEALHNAVKTGASREFVAILINRCPEALHYRDRFWGNTPVMWAIANADNGLAMYLLERGQIAGMPADYLNIQSVDVQSNIGLHHAGCNTALHLALGKGYEWISADNDVLECTNDALAVKMMELGANVNIPNSQGNTPLHLACLRRNFRMVDLLLEYGAQSTPNSNGLMPHDLLDVSYGEAFRILDSTVRIFSLNQHEFTWSSSKALLMKEEFERSFPA